MTIGVDLAATTICAGIVEGGVIYRKIIDEFPHDKPESDGINKLISIIGQLMNSNIKGIGISVPSVVDATLGIVYNSITNLPTWKKVYLKSILENRFGVTVNVNNDCNCLAFAERYYGEGTPYHNIVVLKSAAGLGAGIIINDVLYNGWNTGAGEIGCLPYLDRDFEEYCASNFFRRYNTTGYIAYTRAEKGDKEALNIWSEFGFHIGNLLKIVLFTYDPQAIILGGEICMGYPYFQKSMYEQLSTFPYTDTLNRVEILLSKKEDIGLLGAAALIP